MKTTICRAALAVLALVLSTCAATADEKVTLEVPARYLGDSWLRGVKLTLTPTGPLPRTHYTNVYSRQPLERYAPTNGSPTYFSNVLWGYYTLALPGQPPTYFNIEVGTNLSGVVPIAAVVTNSQAMPPDPSTNYYTKAQADALHAAMLLTGGGSSSIKTNGQTLVGAATNIDFVAGAYTTVTGAVSGFSATIGISVGTNYDTLNVGELNLTNPVPADALAPSGGSSDGWVLTIDHGTNKWALGSSGADTVTNYNQPTVNLSALVVTNYARLYSGGVETLDSGDTTLTDTSSVGSLDWGNRVLKNIAGATVAYWGDSALAGTFYGNLTAVDSLTVSNGNFGVTNYGGTSTIYLSSPNGGGLGSLAFNGSYQFSGVFGVQANQFVGSGAGLTALPANQLSGTIPMANLNGRVVTNANATLSGNQLTTGDGGRGIRTTNLTATVLGASGGVPYSATAAQIGGLFSGGSTYLKADGTTGTGGGSASTNYFHPDDYGALGNGVAVDDAAVSNAWRAAWLAGGVFSMEGRGKTYVVSNFCFTVVGSSPSTIGFSAPIFRGGGSILRHVGTNWLMRFTNACPDIEGLHVFATGNSPGGILILGPPSNGRLLSSTFYGYTNGTALMAEGLTSWNVEAWAAYCYRAFGFGAYCDGSEMRLRADHCTFSVDTGCTNNLWQYTPAGPVGGKWTIVGNYNGDCVLTPARGVLEVNVAFESCTNAFVSLGHNLARHGYDNTAQGAGTLMLNLAGGFGNPANGGVVPANWTNAPIELNCIGNIVGRGQIYGTGWTNGWFISRNAQADTASIQWEGRFSAFDMRVFMQLSTGERVLARNIAQKNQINQGMRLLQTDPTINANYDFPLLTALAKFGSSATDVLKLGYTEDISGTNFAGGLRMYYSGGPQAQFTNVGFNIFRSSPAANQVLFQIGTSDDADRFSVDEDGDVNVDGNMTLQNIVASRFLALNGSKIIQAGGDSAALANSISDETGSGAAVFATAPTFPGIITINGITLTNPVPSVLAISATGVETNASLAVSNLIVRGNIMAQHASGVLILGNGWGGGSITIDTTDIRPTTPAAMALGRWNYPYSAAYSSGVVMSTNRSVANPTYATMDGSRTTLGDVFNYTTNGVSKFSVDTTGAMTVGSTLTGNGTIIGNAGFRAPGANVLSSADCFLGHGIRRYNPASGLTFAFGESTVVGTVGFEILPVSGTTASTNLLMIYRDSGRTQPVFGVASNGVAMVVWTNPAAANSRIYAPVATDSEYLAQLREEFFGGGNASFQIGELGWRNISGGNGTPGAIASEANHPGIFRASTAGSANSYSGFALSQSTSQSGFILSDGNLSATFIFRPSATNTTDIAVGFSLPDQHFIATASANTLAWNLGNICVVSTNGSPWYLHARNSAGGTESWTTTGVVSQSAAWVKAKFRWDAAASIMYLSVNDSAEVSASGASLPPLGNIRCPVFQIITSDTNARDLDADFFWAKQTVTR